MNAAAGKVTSNTNQKQPLVPGQDGQASYPYNHYAKRSEQVEDAGESQTIGQDARDQWP